MYRALAIYTVQHNRSVDDNENICQEPYQQGTEKQTFRRDQHIVADTHGKNTLSPPLLKTLNEARKATVKNGPMRNNAAMLGARNRL